MHSISLCIPTLSFPLKMLQYVYIMKNEIVQVGDPVLRTKAKAVAKKDIGSRAIAGVLKRMKTALDKEEFGVAIAAPQLGEGLRIFMISGKSFLSAEDKEEGKEAPPDKILSTPS